MKRNITLLLVSLLSSILSLNAYADTKFIKYKKYLVPINVVQTGPCEGLKIPANVTIEDISDNDNGQARVFVTTDIGGSDPDDKQSLAHLLTFADELKIVGLATSGPNNGANALPPTQKKNIIHQYIDQYQIQLAGRSNYPDLALLKEHVYVGSELRMAPTNGFSRDTDASKAIIKLARCTYHEDEGRPLYVLVWGTGTDVMRALADPDAQDIRKVVRVVSYSDFNDSREQNVWMDSPQQQDIWLVDYRIGTRPLQNCSSSNVSNLTQNPLSRFTLGSIPFSKNQGGIVFNGNGGRAKYSEGTEKSCGDKVPFTKLGDTITTMFALNPPQQRQSPHNGTTYGRYSLSSLSNTRWNLRSERFKGFGTVYSRWINK